MRTIEQRIGRVELSLSRWRRFAIFLGAVVLAGFSMGQVRATKVLRAGEFVVTDGGGKTRATLGVAGGEPALKLYGSDGTVRVAIDLLSQGEPQIKLFRDGKTRVKLGLGYLYNEPVLQMMDAEDHIRVLMRLDVYGDPRLHMSSSQDKVLNIEPSPMRTR